MAVTLTLYAALTVVTTSLPGGTVGQPYSAQLQAAGGTTPYRWSIIDRNNFPKGLQFSSTGEISGKPNKAGSYAFTVGVTDSAAHSASQSLTMTIAATPGK